MSVVSLLGVNVINNPAKFTDTYVFEITFECLEPLQKGTSLAHHPFPILAHPKTRPSLTLPPHRPRVETHLRRLRPIGQLRPGARLAAGRADSRGDQQVCVRGGPARHEAHPDRRAAWRDSDPAHLRVRRPRVCARGLLCQQRVRERRAGQRPARQARHREDPPQRARRQAARDEVCHQVVC